MPFETSTAHYFLYGPNEMRAGEVGPSIALVFHENRGIQWLWQLDSFWDSP